MKAEKTSIFYPVLPPIPGEEADNRHPTCPTGASDQTRGALPVHSSSWVLPRGLVLDLALRKGRQGLHVTFFSAVLRAHRLADDTPSSLRLHQELLSAHREIV